MSFLEHGMSLHMVFADNMDHGFYRDAIESSLSEAGRVLYREL